MSMHRPSGGLEMVEEEGSVITGKDGRGRMRVVLDELADPVTTVVSLLSCGAA